MKSGQPFGLEKERAGGDQFGISAADQSGYPEHDEDSDKFRAAAAVSPHADALTINSEKVGETKKGEVREMQVSV